MDRLALVLGTFLLLHLSGEFVAASRKKIRIHVPEKVKHIHHHNKVIITKVQTPPVPLYTRHDATELYAPAYQGSETVVSLVPPPVREQSTLAPNLQPQYRARGHYGPTTTLRPPRPPRPPRRPHPKKRPATGRSPAKRPKVITVIEAPVKKVTKKKKIIVLQEEPHFKGAKDLTPNSSHQKEIKTIKSNFKSEIKPKKVIKYVDGNTEHIHTFTEEHIHEVVYDKPLDKGSSLTTITRNPYPIFTNSMPQPSPQDLLPLNVALHQAIHPSMQPFITTPLEHSIITTGIHPPMPDYIHSPFSGHSFQRLVPSTNDDHVSHPIQSGVLFSEDLNSPPIGTVGSHGTPAHLEYMDYNPKEVLHHYHNHGSTLVKPTGASSIEFTTAKPLQSLSQTNKLKNTKNVDDFSKFDGLLSDSNQPTISFPTKSPKKVEKITEPFTNYEGQSFNFNDPDNLQLKKEKSNKNKPNNNFSINHNKPNGKKVRVNFSFAKIPKTESTPKKEQKNQIRNSHETHHKNGKKIHLTRPQQSSQESEEDSYGNSFNDHYSNVALNSRKPHLKYNKSNKKSVSTQNIHFGGQDHESVVDHLMEGSDIVPTIITFGSEATRRASTDGSTYSTADNQPIHFISDKSFDVSKQGHESSNTISKIMEAPKAIGEQDQSKNQNNMETTTNLVLTTPTSTTTKSFLTSTGANKHKKRPSTKAKKTRTTTVAPLKNESKKDDSKPKEKSPRSRGRFKYGDRLNERIDYEYDNVYV